MKQAAPQLVEIVTSLACIAREDAERALTAADQPGDGDLARATLANLVRQAPALHSSRTRLLDLATTAHALPVEQVLVAGHLLRSHPPRFPETGAVLVLPALDPILTGAVKTVVGLEVAVPGPWTLVGGLMVMLHCVEQAVGFTRATGDADVAVGVFTHRDTLRHVTHHLRLRDFSDVTPQPLASTTELSYRWAREQITIDVMVPEGVNQQTRVPRSINRRPSVELPATQQALARSERISLRLADGEAGAVRRPDLLGAMIMKSVAVVKDRRDPARHASDLVSLSDALAVSGLHRRYARELRSKDVVRLRKAYEQLSDARWRTATDPEAARGAFDFLLDSAVSR